MLPSIENIQFEENKERLKIVLPVKKQWIYLVLYSIMLLLWVGMFIYGLIFTWQIAFSGERFAFVFTVMLVGLLYILFRLGKVVWGQWQYYAANREILFIHPEMLIVRRPVSIFGITTAYYEGSYTPQSIRSYQGVLNLGTPQNSELSDELCDEIVHEAVSIALETIESPRYQSQRSLELNNN